MSEGGLYIDGRLRSAKGGGVRSIVSPATGEEVGTIAWATSDDCEDALESARRGFARWSKLSHNERRQWTDRLCTALEERSDAFHQAVMAETGKPHDEADRIEWVTGALRHYSDEMLRMRGEVIPDDDGSCTHQVTYEPLGVVVALLAWNFPLGNLADKVGQSLAAGCSIIVKPSPSAPLSAYLFGSVCAEIDFPAGVINVLCGDTEDIGSALVSSPIPALITMIGSTASGCRVMRDGAATVKRYNLELGGNVPALVFEDADVESAMDSIAALKLWNAGQICVATNRALIHESIFDECIDALLKRFRDVRLGTGTGPGWMGPLIDGAAVDRVNDLVSDAVEKGAKVIFGGASGPPMPPPKGHYFPPTILTGLTTDMRIWSEEVFGPVLAIRTFTDEDDASSLANDTEKGLTAHLFTKDIDRVQRLSTSLRFGEVMVNGWKFNAYLPHHGIGQSGVGIDRSHLGLEQFLSRKRITIKTG